MHHGIWTIVLGLFGLVTIAVLMLPLAKRLRFPYTVLLAAVGILLGLASRASHEMHLGVVSDLFHSFDSLEITSEIIIFLFLPALVFESSLAIDVRKLLADIRPIMFLAVVGLLISAFMVGGAVWAVSGMSFVVCLLLGAILSATDPVAVVAIFKDLGAPKRLAVLVEGESLFNDATAIVLFNIVAAMIIGQTDAKLGEGILDFLKVFIGGILVGLVMARIFVWVIGRIGGAALVEVTLTICLAYLSFLTAEHYLHVSGVMAVVTAALVMGTMGRTSMSAGGWHLLQETWENVGFWANSLIFVLVGLAVPSILSVFTGAMWLTLAVLLASAFVARGVLTHGLLPALSRLGLAAEVNLGFRTVMWWGGLRGAVSLALALAIWENHSIPEDIRSFVVALVCAFVLFTLFVNATTVGLVMKAFDLDKLSPADLTIRNRAITAALERIIDKVRGLADSQKIPPAVADDVAATYLDRIEKAQQDRRDEASLTADDWMKVALMATLGQERRGYLHHYTHGYLSSTIARSLMATSEEMLDATKHHGLQGYIDACDKVLGFSRGFMLALRLQRRFGFAGPLARQFADRMERLRTIRAVLADVRHAGMDDIRALVGADIADRLCRLLDDRLDATMAALTAVRMQYPDYARQLQRRYLERVALRQERQDYDRMHEEAVIGAEIHANLQGEVEERYASLGRRPPLDLGLHPTELVAKVPLFTDLPAAEIKAISNLLKPQLALPGELIVHKGDPGHSMFFVSSGAIQVDVHPTPVVLGSGDFFGEIALLKDAPRTADVEAVSFCDLLILERAAFQKMLQANPELKDVIEKVAAQRLGG